MKAMILAAGRGERMRPLTDHTPKPLLQFNGKRLIEYPIEALATAGIEEIVVNYGWLGEQLPEFLGNGDRYGVKLHYSAEPQQALETGGGILQALPLLGDSPFILVNGDLFTDYPFERLLQPLSTPVHLVLVTNPPHHPQGDFRLQQGRVVAHGGGGDSGWFTYSGIARVSSALFSGCQPGRFPLAPLLFSAVERGEVGAEHYRGVWSDVGTPQRLAALEQDSMVKSG